jgi:PAS domain S-box-containing protein
MTLRSVRQRLGLAHGPGAGDPPEETQASRELASIVEHSDDAIIGKQIDGTITSWNPAAERLYGYSAEEASGAPISLLFPADRPDESEQILTLLEHGGSLDHFETQREHKDGTLIDVELTVSPIVDDAGDVVSASVIAHDISERLEAGELLHRSEESYRLLFNRNPAPMWIFDIETMRFLAVNDAAVEHYGYSRDEFLAQTTLCLVPPTLRTLEHGRPEPTEAAVDRHVRKDGTLIDVLISSNALELEGRAAQFVLSQDVTAQHLLEAQLRQSQKMEAIGNLAGGIAHDFNNILMIIRTCASFLLERADDPETRRDAEHIDKAAERAAELTHQLLAFSREQALELERIDLNAVVEESYALLQRLLGEQIEIVRDLDPTLQPVCADRGQLSQVILNLAVNARDAMPGGGCLTLRTATQVLGEEYAAEHLDATPGVYALLQVIDTGKGMDAKTQARAFEPFFTTKQTGTGFGLATVHGIVEQSGGHVWIASAPEAGTTFNIHLPVARDPVRFARLDLDGSSLEGTETILYVEDDDHLRELIAGALSRLHYTVVAAASGAEALRLADEHETLDILVSDIAMPGLDGRELAKVIGATRPELRVLFTSGYPDDRVVAPGRTGAYIQKPYLPDELAKRIRDLLDTERVAV